MRLMSVWSEIRLRRRRHLTAIIGLAVGVGVLLVIHAMSLAYKEATRLPLREIGADVSIQRSGDVPEELHGVVFPCAAVTITRAEVEAVKKLPGVRAVAESLLLWVFDDDRFMLIIGLDPDNALGPGNLKNFLVDGAFLGEQGTVAVVDATYARDENIGVGDTVTVLEKEYRIGGIVDASRTSKMVKAHIYLPLREAQTLAAASPQVQAVSPFRADDVNVVFLLADNENLSGLPNSIKSIMGEKAVVSTPETFLQTLGSLFALSDKFALATSAIVLVITLLLVLKTVAGGMQERAREIAVLKCLGWRNGNILRQLLVETLAQCFLAGLLGVVMAAVVCWLLSFQTLNIPIPWEMSPTPHFLPGGSDAIFKTVRLPVGLSWPMAACAVLLSLIVGAVTCLLCAGRIAKIKPSEVLRHE